MRRFRCNCDQPLFYENSVCLACGAAAGFDPARQDLISLRAGEDGLWEEISEGTSSEWRNCANLDACGCNWLLPADSPPGALCAACQCTRMIPDLTNPLNQQRWKSIEIAKRRLLLTLLDLNLWGPSSPIRPTLPLVFDFKEDLANSPPVHTGHEDGVITLNIAEADNDQRERLRADLHEPYRTLLGHLRHEVGHFYWELLIKDTPHLTEYRERFGDESVDYAVAMENHYANGPIANWEDAHVSAYATMHSWEDWAETWAHCLHMIDTVETADHYDLTVSMDIPTEDASQYVGIAGSTAADAADFATLMHRWCEIVRLANELSRSMGQLDVYPFALSLPVKQKLLFVRRIITASKPATEGGS